MDSAALSKLPFERHVEGSVVVLVDPELVPPEGVQGLMQLPSAIRMLPGIASRLPGRTTVWRWDPHWLPDKRLVVRQFVHGGLLGRLWQDLFWSARPMLQELRLALHARRSDVPTSRPVALRLERVFGPLLRAHYVTEELPGVQNLLELCAADSTDVLGPSRRQAVSLAVARTLAAMHEAGIDHGDLNLKNLLVNGAAVPPQAYVIDFKKAHPRPVMGLEQGLQNLARLDRSVAKWAASRSAIGTADRLRTLRHYIRLRAGDGADWKTPARNIRTWHPARAPERGRSATE